MIPEILRLFCLSILCFSDHSVPDHSMLCALPADPYGGGGYGGYPQQGGFPQQGGGGGGGGGYNPAMMPPGQDPAGNKL